MLRVRVALRLELARLEKSVWRMASEDPVCLRLMAMPGVGAVVALTYSSAVDDPTRFHSSKNVGPWGGLTPSRSQSGERDVSGQHDEGWRRESPTGPLRGRNGHAE